MRQLQKAVNKKDVTIDVDGKKRDFESSKGHLTQLVLNIKQ